jgi:hypothetical protein
MKTDEGCEKILVDKFEGKERGGTTWNNEACKVNQIGVDLLVLGGVQWQGFVRQRADVRVLNTVGNFRE